MDNWFAEIENKVFTRVKYLMQDDINFTTRNKDLYPDEFPTLYLHELPAAETGNDLDNTTVNAVISTIEIMVWTNTTETDCKRIITDAIKAMKSMRYNVIAFPDVQTVNNISIAVARFRRVIGEGDMI